MAWRKGLIGSDAGDVAYYACDYRYEAGGPGRWQRGYLQSPTPLAAGEVVAIGYLAGRPSISAAAANVKRPWLVPGGICALGLAWLCLLIRNSLRERHKARAPR